MAVRKRGADGRLGARMKIPGFKRLAGMVRKPHDYEKILAWLAGIWLFAPPLSLFDFLFMLSLMNRLMSALLVMIYLFTAAGFLWAKLASFYRILLFTAFNLLIIAIEFDRLRPPQLPGLSDISAIYIPLYPLEFFAYAFDKWSHIAAPLVFSGLTVAIVAAIVVFIPIQLFFRRFWWSILVFALVFHVAFYHAFLFYGDKYKKQVIEEAARRLPHDCLYIEFAHKV